MSITEIKLRFMRIVLVYIANEYIGESPIFCDIDVLLSKIDDKLEETEDGK